MFNPHKQSYLAEFEDSNTTKKSIDSKNPLLQISKLTTKNSKLFKKAAVKEPQESEDEDDSDEDDSEEEEEEEEEENSKPWKNKFNQKFAFRFELPETADDDKKSGGSYTKPMYNGAKHNANIDLETKDLKKKKIKNTIDE